MRVKIGLERSGLEKKQKGFQQIIIRATRANRVAAFRAIESYIAKELDDRPEDAAQHLIIPIFQTGYPI